MTSAPQNSNHQALIVKPKMIKWPWCRSGIARSASPARAVAAMPNRQTSEKTAITQRGSGCGCLGVGLEIAMEREHSLGKRDDLRVPGPRDRLDCVSWCCSRTLRTCPTDQVLP